VFNPCGLNSMQGVNISQTFNRSNVSIDIADRRLTGPHSNPINMHSTGATGRDSASIFDAFDL
jgi:hypothetical protein